MRTYGIVPGPTLMADQADLVWTLLASLLIGNTLLLVINLPLAPLWAKLLRIPRPQLYAGILFFASSAPTRSTRSAPSTSRCCSSSGPWASPYAASGSRSCR